MLLQWDLIVSHKCTFVNNWRPVAMNCWDLLGIEPTSDRQRVEQAYQQQLKFASSDEARSLEQAFREATGAAPAASDIEAQTPPNTPDAQPEQGPEQPQEPVSYTHLRAHETDSYLVCR